ncbi:putative acireductone synthase UTR4-like protein [Leptotrombidium deliense]|uniref:Putative acireductone synthase UTR4-like protein n=1 Tax=Leptotrombidium deliense TaxID=299467 RepID=A0A443SNH8_9ACAR|nr:putative acireductone synthase UTR4-like protein [Leptotrombidium deliense]
MSRKELIKPKAILVRMFGVLAPHSFKEDQLNGFVRNNIKAYIDEQWGDGDLWESIVAMKHESDVERETNSKVPRIANNCEKDEDIKQTVIEYVLYQLQQPHDDSQSEYRTFYTHLWDYGYTKQQLKTELYQDVVAAINSWKAKGIDIYTISSYKELTVQAMLKNTNIGDVTNVSTSAICKHLIRFLAIYRTYYCKRSEKRRLR